MKLKPQAREVLHFLALRGKDGATPAEARAAIACDRLAARVHELRAVGHPIESVYERTPAGARVARYYLIVSPLRPTTGEQIGLAL